VSTDPTWLAEARAHVGLREIPGAPTAPTIAAWLQRLGAWWRDDETPWCGVAVAAWMQGAGIGPLPKFWMRAKAWAEWGQRLSYPAHGCVVVFERLGGGHVGLVVGEDSAGNLLVLGGNQGDAVNVRAFPRGRVLAYRWPPGRDMPPYMQLARGTAAATTGEA
jgi:uncharacterized protein (TIGR02594 family)